MRKFVIAFAVLALVCPVRGEIFQVVTDKAAPIYVSEKEDLCVKLAAKDLQGDIKSITGKIPEITEGKIASEQAIMIGTVGVSGWIKDIETKIPGLDGIRGKKQAYVIKVVKNPVKGVDKALVVIGSDKHGAMWGIYTLCEEELGVDPMKHWTEYEYRKQQSLTLDISPESDYPEIPYRGIFINDEFGLLNWNSDGVRLAHNTQAIIVETLLRLRSNLYCVPMKGKPLTDADNQLIHDRGIFQTASHHEILLAKTQKSEWDDFCKERYGKKVPYSYITNKSEMQDFFVDAINHLKNYNCIWPVGLRGAGDTPFWRGDKAAPEEMDKRVDLVSEGTQWQVDLLKKTTGDTYFNSVPKTLTLYQELMDLHNTGRLKVPEGVMYIWPDDNNGTMRLPEEKPRGQHGVYYHITYCDNHNVQYTSPEQIVYEFKRIMDFGADQYYLVNNGDFKENLIGTEYCMKLAWDGRRTDYKTSANEFLSHWCNRYFPEDKNEAIVRLYEDYFQLAHASISGYAQRVFEDNVRSGMSAQQALKKGPVTHGFFSKNYRHRLVQHSVEYSNWNRLYDRAVSIYRSMDNEEQKDFFRADVIYNIQMHRLMLKWSVESKSAIKAHAMGETQKGITMLESAEKTLDELQEEIDFIERGKFKGWYTERVVDRAPWRWQPIIKKPFEELRQDLIRLLKELP